MRFVAFSAILLFAIECRGQSLPSGKDLVSTNTLKSLISTSRSSSVRIVSADGFSGTGFWITPQYVGTCFHVVGDKQFNNTNTSSGFHSIGKFPIGNGTNTLTLLSRDQIQVWTLQGEKIPAEIVSKPGTLDLDFAPVSFDFAILKLVRPSTNLHTSLPPSTWSTNSEVGDEVVFSGFPLDTPLAVGMVTLKGLLAGKSPDNSVICIQSSINKGNSGGAVLNSEGQVIGIISNREGGISPHLEDVRQAVIAIESTHIGVSFMGVDPNKTFLQTIEVLDKYISVGIGYARSMKGISAYCKEHPYLFQ